MMKRKCHSCVTWSDLCTDAADKFSFFLSCRIEKACFFVLFFLKTVLLIYFLFQVRWHASVYTESVALWRMEEKFFSFTVCLSVFFFTYFPVLWMGAKTVTCRWRQGRVPDMKWTKQTKKKNSWPFLFVSSTDIRL